MDDHLQPSACTCFNLRKAARAITQRYDEALKPSGLRATQFSILAVLARMTPAPLNRLSDALVMDRTTLTRNLRPLVAKGLIVIAEDEDDRRRRSVGLTGKGEKALSKALPLWRSVQEQVVARLTPKRWQRLEKDLGHAVKAASGG
jgi:DNA-binding MarR family transcriptional regulator